MSEETILAVCSVASEAENAKRPKPIKVDDGKDDEVADFTPKHHGS